MIVLMTPLLRLIRSLLGGKIVYQNTVENCVGYFLNYHCFEIDR